MAFRERGKNVAAGRVQLQGRLSLSSQGVEASDVVELHEANGHVEANIRKLAAVCGVSFRKLASVYENHGPKLVGRLDNYFSLARDAWASASGNEGPSRLRGVFQLRSGDRLNLPQFPV